MWPRYLIQARSYISSNPWNVRFLLITSTKMYRNASVKEQKWNLYQRGIDDCLRNKWFQKIGFIALEFFFINHNSYMNEMRTDSIDWLTQLTEWLTHRLTDQFNFVHFMHFPEMLPPPPPQEFPIFLLGEYGYFLYLFWAVKQNCAAFVRFCVGYRLYIL